MTLGLLVGRFGHFVREQQNEPEQQAAPEQDFPDSLEHLREAFAHHLIPLALLARADGDSAVVEQQAMLDHCVACAQANNAALSAEDQAELRDYIATYRPTLSQLDPALKKLEHEGPQAVAAVLTAAEAVANADGGLSPEEARLLGDLHEELEKYS